jgi:hypothetical protein
MLNARIISTIVIVSLIVGGIIGFDLINKNEPEKKNEKNNRSLSVSNLESSIFKKPEDKDVDGLFDWEEILRGTDLNNPDTDNDGTRDGDEIRSGRNPLVAGPDDILSNSGISNPFLIGQENFHIELKEGTLSESISSAFVSNYLLLKENNAFDKEMSEKLAEQTALNIAASTEIKSVYSKSNLSIFSDKNKDKIKKYGNNFANIFIDMLATLANTEESDSKTEQEYLEKIAAVYVFFGEEMLKIEVPEEIANYHLNFSNNLNILGIALLKLNKADDDPIDGIFTAGQFQEASEEQQVIMQEIANYFRSNGIIFSDQESGTMWNNF